MWFQIMHIMPSLSSYLLVLLLQNRLDHMLYVGLTEDHKESATIFANMVGAQVISQSEALSFPEQEASSETGNSFLLELYCSPVKLTILLSVVIFSFVHFLAI